MPGIFTYPLRVVAADVDELGHVNNAVFVRWMQEAAVAHSAAQGWTIERYRAINAVWIAKSHAIEYIRPAFEGQSLLIRTWVSGFRKVMSFRRYRFLLANRLAAPAASDVPPPGNEELLIAEAETKWAFVGLDNLRPLRIPAEMRDSFEVVEGFLGRIA